VSGNLPAASNKESNLMEINEMAATPWLPVEHQTRSGDVDFKFVREGELLPGVNYTSLMIHFNEGDSVFEAPRHHHDFEQVRLSLSGTHDFGRGQVSEEGWVSYFPAGAFYGPERMASGALLQVQWGEFWVTRAQNDRAIAELRERGEFHEGVYSYVDADGKKHNKDGLNAVWEHVFKRESSFPTPRYPDPILMNPDAFEWVQATETTSLKVLGRFTERDLVIFKVRWDADGALHLPEDRTYCVFSLLGEVGAEGAWYGPHTAVWSDAGESSDVDGKAGAEAMCFGFPPTASVGVAIP
jgi:hypothetical protein